MSDSLDPREVKILSDILALVLDDQPGQASNALDALRSRAQRNKTTGGALKNLFVAIAPNPPPRAAPRARASRSTSGAGTADMQAARAQILRLTESLNRMDLDLRTTRAQAAELSSRLIATQKARTETQAELVAMRSTLTTRRLTVAIMALVVGTVVGIAGSEFWHALVLSAPTSNAQFLHG